MKARITVNYSNLKGPGYRVNSPITYQTRLTGYSVPILYRCRLDSELSPDGKLRIFAGAEWDGASGPALDTKSFMDASLAHDKLYAAIATLDLSKKAFRKARKLADQTMRDIARAHGMGWFRAWYTYNAVRVFGAKAARRL